MLLRPRMTVKMLLCCGTIEVNILNRGTEFHLSYNLCQTLPALFGEFLTIPHHPASLLLTRAHPLCSSASSPSVFIQRLVGNYRSSLIHFLDVVQREGPDLIYYTCQLNFWRCTLMHRGWIMYAGCVLISLIIISGHATVYDDFCTWWKTHRLKFLVKWIII